MALGLPARLNLTPELRQLALRLGLAALVLLAAAYALVAMPFLEARRLDAQIARERGLMERQQMLMPAMASLMGGGQNATLAMLLPPKAAPTPRAQAYLVTEQIGQIAVGAGMEPLDVSLNMASLAQTPNQLQAQGVFSGQLDGARTLLQELNRMPSLSRIEKIEVRAVDGRLEMMVQMRIALGD